MQQLRLQGKGGRCGDREEITLRDNLLRSVRRFPGKRDFRRWLFCFTFALEEIDPQGIHTAGSEHDRPTERGFIARLDMIVDKLALVRA